MTLPNQPDPIPGDEQSINAIEQVIVPRAHDIGNFEVRRALPTKSRQMVGPFIFWDQMGPAEFLHGGGIDVRPHPHIGLSTVTYLLEGEVYHRDSLGSDMIIKPEELNWMTAGQGIVHSERERPEVKGTPRSLFGIQSWVALPIHMEETAPAFEHYGNDKMPVITDNDKRVRLIAGSLYGQTSPVNTASETLYADISLNAGSVLPVDPTHEERAIYTLTGRIEINGDVFEPGQLLVLRAGDALTVRAKDNARIMLFGGEPMDGPRHIWWNFVSSSKERIEQAKEDWRSMKFGSVPGDVEEFIPLPGMS
ncbi:pirin family protein [Pseudovibrio sp. SPO723]|uniref:pirin family protein n=1 Tax=Nesiotobacter zosterae TaxID=392721 RepID=UPI0029C3F60F|nr:pirin family protein [Pseudovibrio sp. SPO723]MDX5593595.1 pirin family protein [Pseudovibrio sp. SPO723]